MGYSTYKKLRQVTSKFGLSDRRGDLFGEIPLVQPSAWLIQALEIAEAIPLNNEKVKSERIISPVLSEVHLSFRDKVTLYSGEDLNVNSDEDLNGPCDFFFSAKPNSYELTAPIVAFAEAKDEDMEWGIAQCAAQMYAARLFNQREGTEVNIIYGCATTGGDWRFIQLIDNEFIIHNKTIYLHQTDLLLGVFHKILKQA
jgi:hypothetical protein